ncbi:MAG TPA: hypothetical protein VHB25_01215 [Gemmatimonadaceae bacterium]|nr:hypothetical protein [Gemmatimonadaceae bacterium]
MRNGVITGILVRLALTLFPSPARAQAHPASQTSMSRSLFIPSVTRLQWAHAEILLVVPLSATAAYGLPALDIDPAVVPRARTDSIRRHRHSAVGTIGGAIFGALLGTFVGYEIAPSARCSDCAVRSSSRNGAITSGAVIGAVIGGVAGWWISDRR